MHRPWQDSPAVAMLQQLISAIKKRTKRMIGLIIAIIMGLIAVTATAAVVGTALHTSVQTAESVQQ